MFPPHRSPRPTHIVKMHYLPELPFGERICAVICVDGGFGSPPEIAKRFLGAVAANRCRVATFPSSRPTPGPPFLRLEDRMEFIKRFRLTALAVAVALFLIVLAIVFAIDPAEADGQRFIGTLIAGIPGLAVLFGLWLMRSRKIDRLPEVVTGIGLAAVLIWWWMIVPAVVALFVLWFGLVKGGLSRELTPTATASS